MSVSAISSTLGQAVAAGEFAPRAAPAAMPFSQLLTGLVDQTQQQHVNVSRELERVATGQAEGVNDLVTSVAQADLAFRLMLEIRDRLIASYHEVMRMQV